MRGRVNKDGMRFMRIEIFKCYGAIDLGLKKYSKNGMIKDIEQERDITERWYAGEYGSDNEIKHFNRSGEIWEFGECRRNVPL